MNMTKDEFTSIATSVLNLAQSTIEMSLWTVISKLWGILVVTYLLVVIATAAGNYILATYTDIGRDDSDPPAGRSDMKVMTDHLTGCQYLMGSRGGLTPRLDADGNHICNKQGEQS